MEEVSLTDLTWFCLLVPMPLTVLVSIITFLLEKERKE